MVDIPSPAISIVGRHNSGKTTLIVKLIAELTARGLDVGSVKHHSHAGFEIDYPGKDSYRHREAGATETVIASPGKMARVKTLDAEVECADIVRSMPGHDIVVVEGYRKSGLPSIEVMRAGNAADAATAAVFAQGARLGWPLDSDFTQLARAARSQGPDSEGVGAKPAASGPRVDEAGAGASAEYPALSSEKLPAGATVAVVTDIAAAREAAGLYGIPAFDLDDVNGLADFVEARYSRPKISVVIQAGGESRRMGRSKATVPFAGRPLICRLVERLSPVADELLITTNEPDNLGFLAEEFPDLDIRLVRDSFDERGALQGLYTSFTQARCPHVAVVACDMVFASPALIVAESQAALMSGAKAVVPVNRHGFEPFHALYRPELCLPVLEEVMARGTTSAHGFLDALDFYEFSREEVLAVEPTGGCFINANTPEELRAIEESVVKG